MLVMRLLSLHTPSYQWQLSLWVRPFGIIAVWPIGPRIWYWPTKGNVKRADMSVMMMLIGSLVREWQERK